jgi:hypothetical protein
MAGETRRVLRDLLAGARKRTRATFGAKYLRNRTFRD